MRRCPACSTTYEDALAVCPRDAQVLVEITEMSSAPLNPSRKVRPEDLYIGKMLNNKFRLDALLGRGGMGAVYRATDVVLDRVVAVKLLRHDLLGDESLDSRFLREARAAARIEHPHAVTVHDFGTLPEGSAFIVMELIQGNSLRDLLKSEGKLPPKRAVELLKQACSAVAAAHQVGVIHRDLKPENIMLKTVGAGPAAVKVVDFGLAKLKESVSQSLANLTGHGEIIGTPYYMSPEQCAGGEIDERTDIYSLGIIFYEVLMGSPPFQGTAPAVIGMHLYKAVPSLGESNADIPIALEEIVLKMLAKEKDKRPPNLGAVLKQLDDLQAIMSKPTAEAADPTALRQKAKTLRHPIAGMEQVPANNGAPHTPSQPLPSEANIVPNIMVADKPEPPTQIQHELHTQDQNRETASYNSTDFQTQESELRAAIPAGANAFRSGSVAASSNYRTVPQTTVLRPAKLSYKKYYFIGAAGLLVGAISVFLLQPASTSPSAQRPTVAPVVTRKAPPNSQPATPPPQTEKLDQNTETPSDSTTPAEQPGSRPQEKRSHRNHKEENEQKGGIFKKVGKTFKEGFGLFKGKKDKDKNN